MARCPICGTVLDWIELDGSSRIPDDCPRCTPRGYEIEDEESEDDNA